MTRRLALSAAAMILIACGAGPPLFADTSTPPSTTPASSFTDPTTTANAAGVSVTVTATAVAQPDGSVELCPPGTTAACPGIVFEGDLDPSLISNEGNPVVIQVTGNYDGRALTPSSDPTAFDYPLLAELEYDSLCPELQGTASVNPDEQLQTAIATYVEQQPDFVEMWWDRERAILTVWFKGADVTVHQDAIDALADGEPVCVAGGARFSQAELVEASNAIQGFRDSRGLPLATPGYGVGGLSNRIDLFVEELDSDTRAALMELVGDRVVLYPFIELMRDELTAMPEHVPAVPGDVDILTSNIRTAGGMDALGQFTVEYDLDLNCVYFMDEFDGSRIVPVWPFGYSATGDPLTLYDYDGSAVARAGDQLELGGGGGDIEFIDGNTCDATGAWIVST